LNNIKSVIINVSSDLKLLGWDKPEIFTEADEDVLHVIATDTRVDIHCDCDCIVSLPNSVTIEMLDVGGDASIVDFKGPILETIIAGDLEIARAGDVSISRVGGDLQIHDISGRCQIDEVSGDLTGQAFGDSLQIARVSGDCSIHDVNHESKIGTVAGDCDLVGLKEKASVEKVGGDCNLENLANGISPLKVGGDLVCSHLSSGSQISVGGDASVEITGNEIQSLTLQTGGDLSMHFTNAPSGRFSLKSASSDIEIDLPDHAERIDAREYEFEISKGKSTYVLSAGGGITLTTKPLSRHVAEHIYRHFDDSLKR